MGAFAMDGVVYINGYGVHSGGDTITAWNMSNGLHIKSIEPSQNRGTSSVKWTGGYGWHPRHYADMCQAETHNTNGSVKTARNNETVVYINAHSVMVRMTRNRSTGAISTKSMKTAYTATHNTWGIFAAFNSGKTYDSFLTSYNDPHTSANDDDHIDIYRHDWTGSGWKQIGPRYLSLQYLPGFKELNMIDNASYTYCSIAGLNPYTGRMYIETIGDMCAMHVFQIDAGAKGSSTEWAEVFWNNISNTGAPNYGNRGKLKHIKAFKMPYVNEDTHGNEAHCLENE